MEFPFGKLPFLLDGATGSALQERGMPAGVCPELWILEHAEILIELQREYITAGSDMIYAPTFGSNSPTLARNGITGRTAELNERLAALSISAANGNALVFGDLAPTGLSVKPYGDTEFDELVAAYSEQVKALIRAGIGFFGIETSMSLCEARAAMLALRENTDKPFLASFTVTPNGRSLFGGDLRSALITAQSLGACAFGINCCNDLALIARLLKELSEYAGVPLLAKPNAGIPEMIDGRAHYKLSPEEFAAFAPPLAAFGVGLFGGCCGTQPEHIRALRGALEGLEVAPPACKDKALCASDKAFLSFSGDLACADIVCSDDVADDVADAEDNGAQLVRLSIPDENALGAFLEYQPMLRLPLCLRSKREDILERAVRQYCGVALCDLPKTPFTEMLSAKYGLRLI